MANMGIEVEIYKDSAPFDKIGVIEARQSPTILREIRAVGAGSFVVAKSNPKILADPTLLEYRNFVRVRVNGVCQGGFILKNKDHVIVGEGEQQAEAWSVSGEGLRSWGKDASVRPAKGITQYSRETRYFNFASEQGSWYNPSQWSNATVVWGWNQSGNWWQTAPSDWPDAPNAKWIWDRNNSSYSMPNGDVYFRKEFTLAESGQYALFFGVDDAAEVYMDGELIHTTAEHAWQETTRQDMDLDAGAHVLAFRATQNVTASPGAVISAFYKIGNATSPTAASLIFVSDTSWKVAGYPAVAPGWSPGNILLTLLSEASTRGVRFAQNWTPTFTNTHDSAGDPWGDPISISFGVGANYEEVFQALEEAACDIYLDAETLNLYAWKKRGVDRSLDSTEGTWTEQRRNLIVNPSFESGLTGLTYNRVTGSRVNTWAKAGAWSLALTRTSDAIADAYVEIGGIIEGGRVPGLGASTLKADTTYTIEATYTLTEPFSNVTAGATTGLEQKISLFVHLNGTQRLTVMGVNSAGERTLRGTFTTPSVMTGFNTIRLYGGDAASAPSRIRWDALALYEGAVNYPYADGSTTSSDPLVRNDWVGTPNASASTQSVLIQDDPIVLRIGHNLRTADEKGQADIVNTLLLKTADGWEVKQPTSGTSVAKYGVLEGQIATDMSAAQASGLVDDVFDKKSKPEKTATFELIPVPGAVPLEDFFEGDYVSAPGEVPGVLEKRRIMSISITENDVGDPVYAIEFDAIFSDRTDDLAKMLSKATHASALGGGFTGTTGTPQTPTQGSNPQLPVSAAPQAPTGLVANTVGRWAANGSAVSDYGLTWNPVIANVNNLPVSDIESYEVWGRRSTDTNYALLVTVFDSYAFLSGYSPGEDWYFQVRAISRTGGYGTFTEPVHLVADAPVVPLGPPSQPTLVTELGAVAIRWDGLIAGAAAPTRYKYMEIQRSTAQNGTYGIVGSFVTGSGLDATGIVGTTYWYRLVPVDYLGVKGTASLAASIQVAGVSTAELDAAINDAINGAGAKAQEALDKAVEALGDAALAVVSLITEYATAASETVAPTTGWSSTAPARTPGTFIWQRTQTTYGNDNVVTSSPVILTGNTGSTGLGISSTLVTYQVATSGTTAPTGTWLASVPSVPQGQFLWTRTVTTLTNNSTTTSYAVSRAGADGADGSAGAPGTPGAAATNVVVGNDAVAFPSNPAGATLNAYTVTIPFGGWVGNGRVAATVAVSGLPTGITAGTNTAATTSADGSLILNVASGSTLGGANSGDITLTFTVNGLTFVRRFSWAKALSGAAGSTGAAGKGIASSAITYQVSTDGTTAPTGTWVVTVPTVPQGQFLWTRTVITYTDATTATAYSVGRSGADGAQGTAGAAGADGQTSYLHVAYATNDTGTTGFSTTDPSGKTYMGTYTDFVAADSTNPALYDWVLIKGADGSTGATGKGISSSVVTYQTSASGTTAPTGTWVATVPAVAAGQFLWTRTVLTFTDSATTTTYSVARQGADGSTGATGKGISAAVVTYQTAASGTTAPTGTWVATVPAVSAGQFLWTRTITTYTDSTSSTAYSVSQAGATGAQGTPGAAGADGQTSYLHVAYATNATGTTGFSTTDPSGKTYMGTYTDFTAADSTNAALYDWVLIKGADGATGGQGPTGNGIASAVVTYQTSASGTTAPTGTWTPTVPAVSPGQFLWTRTIITFTDAATTTTYSVGQAGATGSNGVSATSVDIGNEAVVIPATAAGATSAASTITIPFTGFIGTSRAAATVVVSGLPTGITVQTNTPGTTSAAGSLILAVANASTLGGAATGTITLTVTVNGIAFVRLFTWTKGLTGAQGGTGGTGAAGKGVSSVTPYYLLVTTGSAAPAAPTTNPPTGGWSITEPAWVNNTEMYRAEIFVFTDATFGWTSVSKVSSYVASTQAITVANLADAAAKGLVKAQQADPGHAVGRIWLQLDGSGRVIGIQISNGTAWSSYALMADQVLVPSSVGTVSIKDGAISAVKMLIANLDNQLDNPNFTNNSFDGWVRTGNLVGWDTPTSTAAAINRHLRRVTGATATAAGQITNGFRAEVRPGQRVRIDALSYNEGIAPGAWTETRRNLFPDPLATSSAVAAIWGAPALGDYSDVTDMPGDVNTGVRWTRTTAGAATAHNMIVGTTLPRGNVRVRIRVRASAAVTALIAARPAAASATGQVTIAASVAIPAGVSEINITGSAGTFTTTATSSVLLTLASGMGAVGVTLDVTNIAIEALATSTGDVFSGATSSPTDLLQYRWVGTPNASQSVVETRTAPSSIGVQFYDAAGAALSYVQKALDSSGTWVPITYEIDVPDFAYTASLRVEDAGAANDTIRLANLQFRIMGAGQLLVDGTIQGRHVAADTMESRHIKAFAIEVDRLSPTVGSAINLDGNTNINALTNVTNSQQDALTAAQQRLDSVALAASAAATSASAAGSAAASAQTKADGLQAGLAVTQSALDDLGRTYRFTPVGAFIGAPGSPYEFVIQNTGAEIRYNGVPVSSWDGETRTMVVNAFVGNEVSLGNHKLEKDASTGGTVVRKIVS